MRRYKRPYQRFSHAALVISADGTLAEAPADGMRRSPISTYDRSGYRIVRTNIDAADQAEVDFAESVLRSHEDYGYATFAGWAL